MADCETILPWIKPGWIGVEIGVSEGDSAIALLQRGCRFMYLVDPWRTYPGLLDEVALNAYDLCVAKLSPYSSRWAILKMASAEAAEHVPMVDFVWIDGNHRYEWVKSDLELYWPKVRTGGVLCGHDYTNNVDTCQVMRAVDEFAEARGLAVEVAVPCWVIRK